MTVSLSMTQHFIYDDNSLESSRIINSDLDEIHIWCTDWLVSFNLQNMETMLQLPPLVMNNVVLQSVANHKYLG